MANVTRATLSTVSASNFPDNTSQLISPFDLRDWITDGIDSFVTQKDVSTFENAFYECRGSTLTAAATVNLSLATGNFVHVSGTTTITSFGTVSAGARFIVCFDDAVVVTYNATTLIIPGAANITTTAGDCMMLISEGAGSWRVIGYFPASGGGGGGTVTSVTATTPLSSTGGSTPNISIQQASSSQDGYLDSADWSSFNNKQDALSAGTGISIVSNTVTNTAPDQTVTLTPGTGIGVTGTYPSFTITNTSPSSGGTVTSIATSSPITGGTITGSGTIGIQDAAADGSTKGAAAFTASDFNSASGVISIDYTNGQAASGSSKGFLTSADWTTFNNKGTGTVNSGTSSRLAYYAATGTALSETSNMAIDNANGRLNVGATGVPTARVQTAAGTATNGQLLLTPSTLSGALTGTTDGTMWYDTTSNNSSLYLRKLYAAATSILTKFITLDRNPDFTGGTSGLIQADANGTLSKGADLTALGIFAQTNTPTAITTGSGSLIGTVTGVTTLPTNFFGTGKSIKFYLSGLLSMANSGGPVIAIDFRITDGVTTVTLGTLTYDTTNLSSRVYIIDTSITCRSSGSNPVFGVAGQMIVNHTSKSQETVYITPSAVTATSLNTSSALTLQIVATWTNPGTTSSISSIVNYCHYLN